jgi:hypothetical protein
LLISSSVFSEGNQYAVVPTKLNSLSQSSEQRQKLGIFTYLPFTINLLPSWDTKFSFMTLLPHMARLVVPGSEWAEASRTSREKKNVPQERKCMMPRKKSQRKPEPNPTCGYKEAYSAYWAAYGDIRSEIISGL